MLDNAGKQHKTFPAGNMGTVKIPILLGKLFPTKSYYNLSLTDVRTTSSRPFTGRPGPYYKMTISLYA